MSNRYSKTGFTGREEDMLSSMQQKLMNLVSARGGKQDDPRAIQLLFKAQDAISQARYLSREWKIDRSAR